MLGEKEQCFRKLISHLEKPLTLQTQIAVDSISWCQSKIVNTFLWHLLRSFYKYSLLSWLTNPLSPERDVLSVRMCQMLSPAYWCDGWGKRHWIEKERAERMSVISILAIAMEKWHNSSAFAHYCHLRLASLLCLCVLFHHSRSKDCMPLWRSASCASL